MGTNCSGAKPVLQEDHMASGCAGDSGTLHVRITEGQHVAGARSPGAGEELRNMSFTCSKLYAFIDLD